MSSSPNNPDEIKKIESEGWKGLSDFDSPPSTPSELWKDKWNYFLLKKSVRGINLLGKSIVNIGGGHGREAEFLINLGVKNVLLVDIAPGQIRSANLRKKLHHLDNLEVMIGDAEDLDIQDKKYDISYICMALHHFPNHKKSIDEACRVSDQIIFVDIMCAGITKFLNLFGMYNEEGIGIKPNRLVEKNVENILNSNDMLMEIHYYFYPPYYGNNSFMLAVLSFFTRIINFLINIKPITSLFGNVAIIKGNPKYNTKEKP